MINLFKTVYEELIKRMGNVYNMQWQIKQTRGLPLLTETEQGMDLFSYLKQRKKQIQKTEYMEQ